MNTTDALRPDATRATPRLLRRAEVAALLSVHPTTIDNLRRRGDLRVTRIARHAPRFHEDDVASYVAKCRGNAAAGR